MLEADSGPLREYRQEILCLLFLMLFSWELNIMTGIVFIELLTRW